MRTFGISTDKLNGYIKKGLSPDKVNEINTLQKAMDAIVDKKSSAFQEKNLRIGQYINAFILRAIMVAIIALIKRMHTAVSSKPTAQKTYKQLEIILEGALVTLRGAMEAGPVIEDTFEVDV